jgi:hypothetical protein
MSWIRKWLIPIGTPMILVLLGFLVADFLLPDKQSATMLLHPAGCIAVQSAGAVTTAMEGGCRLQTEADVRWYGFTSIRLANKNNFSLNNSEILGVIWEHQ